METEHDVRARAVYTRLLDEKQRRDRGEPVPEKDAVEALKDLYDLFDGDEEVDEFVRALHEWRGYDCGSCTHR